MLAIVPDRAILNPLAGVPLGHYAKHAATQAQSQKTTDRDMSRRSAIVQRFALQDAARRLVPHERVARCCRYARPRETHVELLHSPAEGRAHYGALEVCSSVWLCPVCASKIAARRRAELVQAVAVSKAQGGAVLHGTFTVQHGREDDLQLLLDRFTRAYRRLTGHRTCRKLIRPTYQIFGSVRALEVTEGQNGWHPHYHVLFFLSHPLTPAQLVHLETELRALWATAAAADKLGMNEHGLKLQATQGAVADYIAKFGAEATTEAWGPESELSHAHVKRGRLGQRTPWDLLRAFTEGDDRAAHLWREYASVFKGRQQLTWSPGLRAILGLEDAASDADIAAARPSDAVHLLWITLADWLLVLRYQQRGQLLDVAASGDEDDCRVFLLALRDRRLLERRRLGLDPPLPPAPFRQLPLLLGRSSVALGVRP